jgi:type IV pilus assembly protein PilW
MIVKALPDRQNGLSLIELMVAMVIGLFLILGVTQIFISNQRTYLFQQAQMGNQENGRFTLARNY